MASLRSRRHKVVFVGDSGIGRSSLITVRLAYRAFRDKPPPFIQHPPFVHLVTTLELDEPPCAPESALTTSKKNVIRRIRQTELHIVNVADNAPLQHHRNLYEGATAVVFCFSIGDESSFENIKNKWYPEIRHYLPGVRGVPMLLLGMKSDLRDHSHQSGVPITTREKGETTAIGPIVSEQRAQRLAEALGAERYLECSAKRDIDSVRRFFDVLATTSRSYVARAELDQTHTVDWKGSFSMPVIHNSERIIDNTIGTSWSFWAVLNRMQQRRDATVGQ